MRKFKVESLRRRCRERESQSDRSRFGTCKEPPSIVILSGAKNLSESPFVSLRVTDPGD
jgi:hypothetical protein